MDGIADLICPVVSTRHEDDFRKVIRYTIAQGKGANIIFALGTNGEFYTLSLQDKKDIAAIAIDEVKKQKELTKDRTFFPLEIAVGITGNNIDETIELARHAEDQKADYAVLMPIYITRKSGGDFTRRGVTDTVNTVLGNTKK